MVNISNINSLSERIDSHIKFLLTLDPNQFYLFFSNNGWVFTLYLKKQFNFLTINRFTLSIRARI